MSPRRPKPRTGDTPLFDAETGAPSLELRGMPEKPRAAEKRIFEAAFAIARGYERPPAARSETTQSQHADLRQLKEMAEQVSRNLKRFELTGHDPTSAKSLYVQYIDSEVTQAAAFAREAGMGLSAADRAKSIRTRAGETQRSRENVLTLHAASEHYADVFDAWEATYAGLPQTTQPATA